MLPNFHGPPRIHLLHAVIDVPMYESALGIHKIELVIQTSPGLGNGGGVGQHADGTLNLGQIATWHNSGWLIVDADLETGRTPVDAFSAEITGA